MDILEALKTSKISKGSQFDFAKKLIKLKPLFLLELYIKSIKVD